jgi:hypothetical protein
MAEFQGMSVFAFTWVGPPGSTPGRADADPRAALAGHLPDPVVAGIGDQHVTGRVGDRGLGPAALAPALADPMAKGFRFA